MSALLLVYMGRNLVSESPACMTVPVWSRLAPGSSLPVLSTFPSLCFPAVSSIVRDFSTKHVTKRGQANIKLRGT